MLPLGRIGIGFKNARYSGFTREEQRTMMTLWCIFRSPLKIGGVLPDNDEWTSSLLTNSEVLDVQKHGSNPTQIALNDKEAVWMNEAENGAVNLALFNLSDGKRTVSCPLAELGFDKAALRDLWNKQDMGYIENEITAEILPHGSMLYRLTGAGD
jgi:hypothetical protein